MAPPPKSENPEGKMSVPSGLAGFTVKLKGEPAEQVVSGRATMLGMVPEWMWMLVFWVPEVHEPD
ncbi:MAG: hypothetical protein U0176_23440 [Bacteroidia bacterium]